MHGLVSEALPVIVGATAAAGGVGSIIGIAAVAIKKRGGGAAEGEAPTGNPGGNDVTGVSAAKDRSLPSGAGPASRTP